MKWKWKLAQKLEFVWWQRYLKSKDAGAYLDWKKRYWQELLTKISPSLPHTSGLHILDAGCGPAGIFLSLEGNQVDAIDSLLDKYQLLPHFQPGKAAWTRFRKIPLEELDETEKYDIVFCMNVINHVQDLALCYDKLAAALKPNGYLVISTDAHRNGFLKKIFQMVPGDMLHPVQLDINEYAALLKQRGMSIINQLLYKQAPIFNYYITTSQKKAS